MKKETQADRTLTMRVVHAACNILHPGRCVRYRDRQNLRGVCLKMLARGLQWRELEILFFSKHPASTSHTTNTLKRIFAFMITV